MDEKMSSSVIINQNNPLLDTLKNIETNLVVLPSEPYDFYVGSILFSKLFAITEKYFDINYITIDSAVGDCVQYTVWDPEDSGLNIQGDFWWNRDNANTNEFAKTKWEDLNLKDVQRFEPTIIKGGLSES